MERKEIGDHLDCVRDVKAKDLFRYFKGRNLLLTLWILFSIPFVLFSLWTRVEQKFYKKGIQVGSLETAKIIYKDIIVKAKNKECKTIFVEQEGDKVDLINVACLRRTGEANVKPKDNVAKSAEKKKKGKIN